MARQEAKPLINYDSNYYKEYEMTIENSTDDYLTDDYLAITAEELLILKQENPFEIEIIMEMLAEAGEDFSDEVSQLERMPQAA